MDIFAKEVIQTLLYKIILSTVVFRLVYTQTCDKLPGKECSCTMSDGSGVIDLKSLSYTDGSPAFPDTYSSDGYYYSYNPCAPFSQGSCFDAAGCQVTEDQIQQYTIADISSETFYFDGNNLHLTYTHTDGSGFQRSLDVKFVCDPSADPPMFVADGEPVYGSGQYYGALTTKCACPNGCGAPNPPKPNPGGQTGDGEGGLTPGSVLCIVFFSLVFVYIVGGVIYKVGVKKASGKDVVPNAGFWTSLPGYIKDGFIFTYQKICRRSGYEKT